jgi:dTDP-4-amino-4,6-dideoxygalactose transaminase
MIAHNKPTFPTTAAKEVLESGYLAAGPKCEALEVEWCRITGAESAVAVSNGTSALRLALRALNASLGDVLIPAYSCNALINSVKTVNSQVTLTDIRPDDLTIDMQSVLDKLTNYTKTIIVTHTFGAHSQIPTNLLIPNLKRTIPVVEDMSHGVFRQQADLAVASFGPTKLIGSCSGGIVSGPRELIDRIKDLRDYSDKAPSTKQNDMPNDLAAAIALEQLKRLDEIREKRRKAAIKYDTLLESMFGKVLCPGRKPFVYRYVVNLGGYLAADISKAMKAKGIHAEQPIFDPRPFIKWPSDLPNTDKAFDNVLSLPFYESITQEEQEEVVKILEECLK